MAERAALRIINTSPELSDDAALAWLAAQPGGINAGVSELARRWKWNRSKVARRLKKWSDAGLIKSAAGPGGRTVITVGGQANSAAPELEPAPPEAATPPEAKLPHGPNQGLAQILVPRSDVCPCPDASRAVSTGKRGLIRAGGGVLLGTLALAIAWYGLNINAWYGATLGRTTEAGTLFAGLSVAADVLALILPSAACALWQDGRRSAGTIAWSLWGLTIMIALMATVGFASMNIADTTAERGKAARETSGLLAKLDTLRSERSAITEARSLVTIQAELQRAQPGAASVWKATMGCMDVTRVHSGRACGEVLQLRQALGTAQRREALDLELRQLETDLARRPAITVADPQVETAAKLLNWVTRSTLSISPGDIHMARVLGMTLLPQLSGLVFMLAVALWPANKSELKLTGV